MENVKKWKYPILGERALLGIAHVKKFEEQSEAELWQARIQLHFQWLLGKG